MRSSLCGTDIKKIVLIQLDVDAYLGSTTVCRSVPENEVGAVRSAAVDVNAVVVVPRATRASRDQSFTCLTDFIGNLSVGSQLLVAERLFLHKSTGPRKQGLSECLFNGLAEGLKNCVGQYGDTTIG